MRLALYDERFKQFFIENLYYIDNIFQSYYKLPENIRLEVAKRLFSTDYKKKENVNDILIANVLYIYKKSEKGFSMSNLDYDFFWHLFLKSLSARKILLNFNSYKCNIPRGMSRDEKRAIHRIVSKTLPKTQKEDDSFTISYVVDDRLEYGIDKIIPELVVKVYEYYEINFSESYLIAYRKEIKTRTENNDIENNLTNLQTMIVDINSKINYNKEVLTLKESASFLGVSPKTMYDYNLKRIIPFYSPNGKLKYYNKSELINFMKSNRFKSNAEVEIEAKSLLE